jgi:hypothetical protein
MQLQTVLCYTYTYGIILYLIFKININNVYYSQFENPFPTDELWVRSWLCFLYTVFVIVWCKQNGLRLRNGFVSCHICIVWQCASNVNSKINTGLCCIFLPSLLQQWCRVYCCCLVNWARERSDKYYLLNCSTYSMASSVARYPPRNTPPPEIRVGE